ncbi:hypothetical protein BGS_0539 [Beggiatoa sp. SS]|nr:hypothetical protein BGS_0539 [Beggiatoa sp. SS]
MILLNQGSQKRMFMDKKSARLRRARRTRAMIKKLGAVRLCVHKTPQHIYAQIIASNFINYSISPYVTLN